MGQEGLKKEITGSQGAGDQAGSMSRMGKAKRSKTYPKGTAELRKQEQAESRELSPRRRS